MQGESEIYQFLKNIKTEIENNFKSLIVLIENKGDIAFDSENALSKQGLYVLLRVPEIANNGQSQKDKLALNIPNLMIQICENVAVNRAKFNLNNNIIWKQSAPDLAIDLTKFILKNYSEIFTLSTINNDFEDNLMYSTINFESTLVLTL